MKPRHALLAALLAFTAATSGAPAAEPQSLTGNGAVIYSSPLAHGASPNNLLNGKPLAFSKKGNGPHVLVIDLGQTCNVNSVSLKFSKPAGVKLYAVNVKPGADGSWTNLVQGQSPAATLDNSGNPASLDGVHGQYLILIADGDPGIFSGFNITGSPFGTGHTLALHPYGPNPNGAGSEAETPFTGSTFDDASGGGGGGGSTPNVPPTSH
jgi:hypothetical protein